MIEISDGIERHFFPGDNIERDRNIYRTRPSYVKVYEVKNEGTSDLTDYQVKVENGDFSGDIGFLSDGFSRLYYWKETSSKVWVKVPEIPGSSTTTIYMYYGNPDAGSESDGEKVFEFFDDFEGIELDTTKWQTFGTFDVLEVINGELHGKTEQGSALVVSKSIYNRSIIIESVARLISREVGEAYLVQDIDNWMNNYYFKGDQWYERIKRRKSGSESVLATQTVSLAFNTYYLLKTILKSSDIIFKIYDMDGNLKVTVTASDTTWSNGYVGFRTYGSSGSPSEWYVDWIRIRKYTSPEPTIQYLGDVSIL